MEEIRAWSGVVGSVLSVIAMFYTWMTARSRANAEEIGKHNDSLKKHDRRIQALEDEMKHLPSKDDFSELRLAISEVTGQLGRLEESHLGVNRAVRRIEEYLLKEKS